jgi:hypothetical protein
MGGVGFTTIVACVVESAIVEGTKGALVGPLVVVCVRSGGVDEEVLNVVMFKGCKLANL